MKIDVATKDEYFLSKSREALNEEAASGKRSPNVSDNKIPEANASDPAIKPLDSVILM